MRLWPLRWKTKQPDGEPGDPAPEPPPRPSRAQGGRARRGPPARRRRDEEDDDKPVSIIPPILSSLGVMAGLAALVAWLVVNADDTMSRRVLETPRVALRLVAEAKEPPPAEGANEAKPAAAAEAAKAEPQSPEPAKSESAAPEPAKTEPPKPEIAKTETAKAETPPAEPPKAETGHGPSKLPPIEAPKLGTAPAAKPAEVAHGAAPAPTAAEGHGAPPPAAAGGHGAPAAEKPAMQLAARTNEIGPPVVLRKAPEPTLTEQGARGPLPIVSEDGKQAWRFYARPFDSADRRPRVAVVIAELGLSSAATEAAVQNLPGAVSLAFAPYAPRLEEWMAAARAAGHETLIMLPMEPSNFPTNDPGPYTLLTSLSSNENLDRLDWVLSRVAGYVGVLNYGGTRFASSEESLQPVMAMLKRRGLLFIDGWATSRTVSVQLASALGVPSALGNRRIDAEASRGAIDQRLAELEKTARDQGEAVGIGGAYPVTLERVAQWALGLGDRGLALAPVSALAGGEKHGQ